MQLDDLGRIVLQKQGSMGVRAAAREIGISPTTLSKIVNGHIPDQATLKKVCDWIGEEVTKFTAMGGLQIAFKKDQTLSPTTAQSLARLIERAEEQFKAHVSDVAGH
jgi:transcriptional regulator with XRE-family HTH domain